VSFRVPRVRPGTGPAPSTASPTLSDLEKTALVADAPGPGAGWRIISPEPDLPFPAAIAGDVPAAEPPEGCDPELAGGLTGPRDRRPAPAPGGQGIEDGPHRLVDGAPYAVAKHSAGMRRAPDVTFR